ncbi:MAG: hypothetical protein AAB731_03330, partial [Patescibacteria group bacterium]
MKNDSIFAPLILPIGGKNKDSCKIIDFSESIAFEAPIKLFGVIDTTIQNFPTNQLADLASFELQRTFNVPESLASEDALDRNLDLALKNINASFYKFLTQKMLAPNENNFHLAIGALLKNYFVLAIRGNIRCILFHRDQNERYSLINIAGIRSARMNLAKIFSQTVAGNIGPEDVIFISSPEITDLISSSAIKKMVTEGNAAAAKDFIKNDLMQKDLAKSVCAVIIKLREQRYRDNIIGKEAAMPGAVKNSALNGRGINYSFYAGRALRYLKIFFSYLLRFIMSAGKFLFNLARKIPRLLKKIIEPRATAAAIKNRAAAKIDSGIQKFNSLPKLSRVLLVVFLVLTTLTLQGVYFLREKHRLGANNAAIEQKMQLAKNEKESAESSLAYGDKKTAISLLTHAKETLSSLTAKAPKNTAIKNLLNEIDAMINKSNNITQIENPIVIAVLKDENTAKFSGLLLRNGVLYSWQTG